MTSTSGLVRPPQSCEEQKMSFNWKLYSNFFYIKWLKNEGETVSYYLLKEKFLDKSSNNGLSRELERDVAV